MQLKISRNSKNRAAQLLVLIAELVKLTVIFLATTVVLSTIFCVLLPFAKIIWMFSLMLFKAFGQF